jgi:geranylgeranyl pyrophosphate synthase
MAIKGSMSMKYGGVSTKSEPIPSIAILDQILDLRFGSHVDGWLRDTLLTPVADMLERPSKRFRSELVRLGCLLTSEHQDLTASECELCLRFGDLIELLHAGSLVVDDIEDQSQMRRGQPTLHLKYGVPLALNAGNWLYFWSLALIDTARLPPMKELWVQRRCHRVIVKLHCGQALDNGVVIDTLPQRLIPGLCVSSMELKTGSLLALALSLGSVAAQSPIDPLPALDEFGYGAGIALQMFDDLGNLQGETAPEKKYEDLINRRPCWVWAFTAQRYSEEIYQAFTEAVRRLPDDEQLKRWLIEQDFLSQARLEALAHLERVYQRLEDSLGVERRNKAGVIEQLRLFGQRVSNSYC